MDYKQYFRSKESPSILLVLISLYIFLAIDRPWESIRYLREFSVERPFAIAMIIVAIITKKAKVVDSPISKWILAMLFLHFALSPFAFNPKFALDTAIDYGKAVIIYFLILAAIENQMSLKFIIKAFVFSMMLFVLHSLWEYHNGAHVYRMGIARMVGVGEYLSDPNAFGASIVLSFPFIFLVMATEESRVLRIACWLYLIIGIGCVVLTGSRSAFMGLILLIVLLCASQPGKKKIFWILTAFLSVAIIWQIVPEDKQSRIRTLWDESAGPTVAYDSAKNRMIGWMVSWEMFKREPFTGVGVGGDNFIGYRMRNPLGIEEQPLAEQSHILYGEVLAEQGIFGGILFVCFVVSISRSVCSVKRQDQSNENRYFNKLANAISFTLILLLFLGIGGHNFYRPLWLWIAAWAGAMCRLAENQAEVG